MVINVPEYEVPARRADDDKPDNKNEDKSPSVPGAASRRSSQMSNFTLNGGDSFIINGDSVTNRAPGGRAKRRNAIKYLASIKVPSGSEIISRRKKEREQNADTYFASIPLKYKTQIFALGKYGLL